MAWPEWATWPKWGVSGGATPDPRLPTDISASEGTALLWLYDNLDGENWDNNANWGDGGLAANWAGVTVTAGKVTGVNLFNWADNSLSGDITNFPIHVLTALTTFIVGDNTGITGSIFGWSFPATMLYVHFYNTGISGDITGYTIPSGMVVFTLDNTSCTGSVNGIVIPASLYQFSVGDTTITGVPDFSSAEDLGIMYHKNSGLSQVEVDLYLSRVYARRASFTALYGTPSLQIHGTNATPSGIYQDADPPTTGKEYAYELIVDPESEGFNKWQVLYTADPRLPSDISAAEGSALLWLYDNLDGANWDNNTNWGDGLLAANWDGITVAGGKVTVINLFSYWDNSLSGDISGFGFHIANLTGLLELTLGGNSAITGDISGWTLPASLQQFNMYYTGISGDVTGIGIPSLVFAVDNTNAEGDFDGWAIPATLAQFAIGVSSCEGVPDFTNAQDLGQVVVNALSLSQADVDLYLSRIYAIRNNLTGVYYDNDLDIALQGNTTPSGIYQDGDPPTTGQEYVYELVNDPESEGFIPIDITYDESWAIQGVIQDGDGDGLDGVTVSLTGDASDSTVTAGGGLYAFTNLDNGSYTVTPSKVGSTFSPASDPVTVADGNETAATMAEVWVISGNVSDYLAAGVSGVTLTLTGDASDSTSSDGDGNYEFTGLSNGSYTVTPSLAGRDFNPASRAVTVADGDQTGKDFTRFLAIPYTYDVSTEVSETSGGVGAQLSDWTVTTGLSDADISTSNLADSNSFTPSGVTKRFGIEWGAARESIINDLPDVIDPALTSLRIAILIYTTETDRALSFQLSNLTAAQQNAGSPAMTGLFGIFPNLASSNDQITYYSRYESETLRSERSAFSESANGNCSRYHWVQQEYNFVDDTVKSALVRAQDNSSIWSDSVAMHSDGQTLGHVPAYMRALRLDSQLGSTTCRFVRYWIGTADDAWPSVAP